MEQQGAANADANVDVSEEADDDSSDANVDASVAESSAVQVGTATTGEDSDDDSISDEELHEMYAVCAAQKDMTVPQYIEYLRSLEDEVSVIITRAYAYYFKCCILMFECPFCYRMMMCPWMKSCLVLSQLASLLMVGMHYKRQRRH